MPVHLNDEQESPLDLELWQERAERLHQACGLSLDADEWSLSFIDAAAMQELNRTYRGVDRPTDVLAFSQEEGDGPDLPLPGRLLGDVVVAVDVACAQAEARGHAADAELALLVAHGLLHLLGEDHDTAPRKARMWRRQGELLALLGMPAVSYGDENATRRAPRAEGPA